MSDNPMKICFYLQIDQEFWGEVMVADRLSRLPKLVTSNKIDLDRPWGAVSIRYNDEEILGLRFHDIISNVDVVPNALLEGKQWKSYLPYAGTYITFTPQADRLIYHVSAKKRGIKFERDLPLDLFIQEWTFMHFRFTRLIGSLGDSGDRQATSELESFMSPQWISIVGAKNILHWVHSDLSELLIESGCEGGYIHITNYTEFKPII